MKRTKNMLSVIIAVFLVGGIFMISSGYAEWDEKLKLPSEKKASPTPQPAATKPDEPAVTKSDLKFPTTAEEIVNSLQMPPVLPKREGTRGPGGITVDEIVANEKFLEKMSKVGALILFDFDSDRIKDESLPLLTEYGKALQGDLKDAKLVVAGHTDSTGTAEYNLDLSRRRAEAIKKFLTTEFQVANNRLFVKPYGKIKPIAPNETEEGRAQNRRAEFVRVQ